MQRFRLNRLNQGALQRYGEGIHWGRYYSNSAFSETGPSKLLPTTESPSSQEARDEG